ncbi:alpha/beta hydrolase [Candidatus Berkelbacteria bacterium]|nr:alpha/beta hydrolase [Candidatus Berkelbacteria bacterium]
MQKKVVGKDSVSINYDLHPKWSKVDHWLIFVHGAGGDLNAWHSEREFFHQRGLSTLALDLRGHGLSDRPAECVDYTLDRFATDIQTIVEAEAIKKFVLIGHSFGGMVILTYHHLFSRLAQSYVLIDTSAKPPAAISLAAHHPFLIHLYNHLTNQNADECHFSHVPVGKFVGTADWDPTRIYSDIIHTTLRSWLNTYEAMGNFDATRILPTIHQPTLVLHGADDSVISPKVGKELHEHTPRSTFTLIPNANHISVLNNPDEIETAMAEFLHTRCHYALKK